MTFPPLSRYANLELSDDHLGHGARRTDSLTTTLDAPIGPSCATRTTAISEPLGAILANASSLPSGEKAGQMFQMSPLPLPRHQLRRIARTCHEHVTAPTAV